MAKGALDLCIQITGKVDKSLQASFASAQKETSSFASTVSATAWGIAAAAAAGIGATVKTMTDATKTAISYESAMADVAKVVDGLRDKNGQLTDSYWEMKDGLKELITRVPMTFEEAASIAAAGGQSGIAKEDLLQYTENAAQMSIAFDVDAEQAGKWMANWRQAYQMSQDDVVALGDKLNYLSNHTNATAAELAEVIDRTGSIADLSNIDLGSLAAVADTIIASGSSAETAATGLRNMILYLNSGSSATKAQKEAFETLGFSATEFAKRMQTDGTGAIVDFMAAVKELPQTQQISLLMDMFGLRSTESAAKLAQNIPSMMENLSMVADEELWSGSMLDEFNARADTTENSIELMMNAIRNLGDTFGTMLLPFVKDAAGRIENFCELIELHTPEIQDAITQVIDYIRHNGPEVAKILGAIGAAWGSMVFAPQIEDIFGGAKAFLFGSGEMDSSGNRNRGLIGNSIQAKQNIYDQAGNIFSAIQTGMGLGNSSLTAIDGQDTAGIRGRMNQVSNSLLGGWFGFKNRETLLNTVASDKKYMSGLLDVADQIAAAKESGGILSLLTANAKNAIATSAPGQYLGGIKNAVAGVGNTKIGSAISGGLKSAGTAGKGIISGIFSEQGILPLAKDVDFVKGMIRNAGLSIAYSAPGRAIAGAGRTVAGAGRTVGGVAGGALSTAGRGIGNLASFAGAGANVLGAVWSPAAGGFMSLLAGSAPIIAGISGIIAVLSILYDNMDGIRNLVGETFGEQGLAVFDTFKGGLDLILNTVNSLFNGGVAERLAPVQEAITGMFGADAGAAFGGVVTILQSIMGVAGQVVSFANTQVKPIIVSIFAFLTGTVLPQILQMFTAAAPTISQIISALGTAVMTAMSVIGQAITAALPFVQGFISVFLSIASAVIPAVLYGIQTFSSGILSVVTSIQGIFNGLVDFITGVFTGDWSLAWEGVKEIFGNAFDALVELCKTPINAVIGLINSAFSAINSVSVTVPEWVPGVGGKTFTPNLPELPQLALGGFTSGPSIAGEAGTEAVISFQNSARASNIATWLEAGKLLGLSNLLGGRKELTLKSLGGDPNGSGTGGIFGGGSFGSGSALQPAYAGGTVTYAPVYNLYGSATREDAVQAEKISQAEFDKMMKRWQKDNDRRKF